MMAPLKIPGLPEDYKIISEGKVTGDSGWATMFFAYPGEKPHGRVSWMDADGHYNDVYFGVEESRQFSLNVQGQKASSDKTKFTSLSFNDRYIYVTGCHFNGKPGKHSDTIQCIVWELRTGRVLAVQYEVTA